ncbi:MAG: lactate utilization protein [Deltaproteobacteria bacterium]|nr:lactate utilization protein [Deltaproteobacteria bacterium]MBW2070422.1 lactate utilization protein [Deltaproteobacteria bacterium]
MNLSTLFTEAAGAVQAIVKELQTFSAALHYAVDLTIAQGGRTLAAPGLPAGDKEQLRKLCEKQQLTMLDRDLRQQGEGFHTGFTVADWGIAETGTVVLDSSSEDLRLASMLCETHVAVVASRRLLANTQALEEEVNQLLAKGPRYLAFITGASRTADIERVLTIGVHGPKELHVLLLQEI